jgi:hypothetical protein
MSFALPLCENAASEMPTAPDRGVLAAAFVLSFVFALPVGCGAAYQLSRPRREWLTDPTVVCVSKDVAPGTVLTREMLTTRPMAHRLRSSSIVDSADIGRVVGVRTMFPLKAEDCLYWNSLAVGVTPQQCKAMCRWVGDYRLVPRAGTTDQAGLTHAVRSP